LDSGSRSGDGVLTDAGIAERASARAAYGWKADLSDDEILERLLALNLERAKENK
jgi:hypothetical protein